MHECLTSYLFLTSLLLNILRRIRQVTTIKKNKRTFSDITNNIDHEDARDSKKVIIQNYYKIVQSIVDKFNYYMYINNNTELVNGY